MEMCLNLKNHQSEKLFEFLSITFLHNQSHLIIFNKLVLLSAKILKEIYKNYYEPFPNI